MATGYTTQAALVDNETFQTKVRYAAYQIAEETLTNQSLEQYWDFCASLLFEGQGESLMRPLRVMIANNAGIDESTDDATIKAEVLASLQIIAREWNHRTGKGGARA